MVMAGGFDTTTTGTANALIYLADQPEQRKRLIDNPDMIGPACEEFLRYFTSLIVFPTGTRYSASVSTAASAATSPACNSTSASPGS